MYLVVRFQEDNSVEAVPYILYDNGYCVLPTKNQNISSLIKKKNLRINFHVQKYKHIKWALKNVI